MLLPKLLEKGLWQIGDRIVFCGRGVVPFKVLVHMTFVDANDPWFVNHRLMTGQKTVHVELRIK